MANASGVTRSRQRILLLLDDDSSTMTSARLHSFIEALSRRVRFGMFLGLDRVHAALGKLGDPHLAVPYVHIAGTNGKGSTSAMVASILRAAGLRTGLYTSPHLCRLAERMCIDGEPASDETLADAFERVYAVVDDQATFFEVLTLVAFVLFQSEGVDIGVLEVGLGGRLDATNVITRPLATAITSISFDHTAVLGNTLDAIAREKAGIFKPGVPVVLGPLPSEALSAALEVAANVGASPVVRVGQEIAATAAGCRAQIVLPSNRNISTNLSLAGAHQLSNAAIAASLSEFAASVFPQILPAIETGLSSAKWPGRLERIECNGVQVLLDCAHNPEGASMLAAHVKSLGLSPDRVVLIFGALADKSWLAMLDLLGPLADRRVYAAPKGRVPAPLKEMVDRQPGDVVADPREAIKRALELSRPGDVVVVAGSIFLVAEIRAELLGLECDPIVAL